MLLTLRAIGWPHLPQGSNGLPQELGMYSENKQVATNYRAGGNVIGGCLLKTQSKCWPERPGKSPKRGVIRAMQRMGWGEGRGKAADRRVT